MASVCSTVHVLSSPSIPKLSPLSSSLPSTSASSSISPISFFLPRRTVNFNRIRSTRMRRLTAIGVRMGPEEEKLTRRNPLDFPVEWERPKPARRPDIFPQFSPMKTPLPPPMPFDPPPEEDEEDEEGEEKKKEEEEDPDKEEEEKPEKPETPEIR